MNASPVNVPLTPFDAAFVGAGAAAVLSVAVLSVFELEEVLDEEFDEVFEPVELEFFVEVLAVDLLEVEFFEVVAVDFLVVVAFLAVVVCVLVVTTALELLELFELLAVEFCVALADELEVAAEAPDSAETPLEPSCGGVTDKTAPRPPTVPPAINNARFMPSPHPLKIKLELLPKNLLRLPLTKPNIYLRI